MDVVGEQVKTAEVENEDGKKETKYFVKGARLDLYPAKFNMIRSSRGVKRPTEELISQEMAEKKVSSAKLTYEKQSSSLMKALTLKLLSTLFSIIKFVSDVNIQSNIYTNLRGLQGTVRLLFCVIH